MSNLLAWEALQELGGFTFIYFILGYGLVFVGIFILIGALWLLKTVLPHITKTLDNVKAKRAAKKEAKIQSKKAEVKAAEVEKTQENKQEDDTEEIPEHVRVAIVAAIAAYYEGEQQKKCDFKVRRIKRI